MLPRLASRVPQDTSNTAWSCSALRFYDEMLLDSLAQEVCCSSEAFPDQAIVNTLTSFARLGVHPALKTLPDLSSLVRRPPTAASMKETGWQKLNCAWVVLRTASLRYWSVFQDICMMMPSGHWLRPYRVDPNLTAVSSYATLSGHWPPLGSWTTGRPSVSSQRLTSA